MKVNVICIMLLAVSLSVNAQTDGKILEGKTFSIKVTECNSTGSSEQLPKDRIQFRGGKIVTGFAEKNSFPKANYIVTIDPAQTPVVISFTAACVKSDKQTLTWDGTIVGDKIEGKAHRDRNGKSWCDYYFKGTLNK